MKAHGLISVQTLVNLVKGFFILIALFILVIKVAYSGGVTGVPGGAAAQSGSQSFGQAAAYGSNVSIDSHGRSYVNAPDLSRQVPNIIAPSLTTSSESCMGSTSGGITVAGFGMTLGSTWSDDYCRRRLDARQWHSMGMMPIGKELMCVSEENYEAAKRAGIPCVLREGDSLTAEQELAEQRMRELADSRRKYIDLQALEQRMDQKFNNLHRIMVAK